MGGDTQSRDLDDEALAWLALATAPGLPPRLALDLVRRLGSPGAVLAASERELVAAEVSAAAVAGLANAAERARAEAAALATAGATLVVWGAPSYPAQLREIPDPPLTLAVRGTLDPDEPMIAIVGARRASEYGRRMAAELATGLVRAGLTVTSGLAAGIDGAAHHAALEAGGRTVAVLGTGIDQVYPSWHGELAARVAAAGALVSEFPCGTPPFAQNFPRRNRVISGLALGTVVVEATEDSGSLITARFAGEQNRFLFAVPGPVGVARHRGPHRLIREGATLVTCADDVTEQLPTAVRARLVARQVALAARTLTAPERRLLDVLGVAGLHVDDLVRAVGLPAGPMLETLLALELRGLVQQLPGRRFCRLAA